MSTTSTDTELHQESVDVLDRALEAGSKFDGFSPAWGMIQDAVRGKKVTFLLDGKYSPLSLGKIKRVLKKKKLDYWNSYIHGDLFIISIKEEHARYAYYLLSQEGVRVLYPAQVN